MTGMRFFDLMYYVLLLPGAFFAPVIHESIKAMCSARQGDPTPKKKGFLTWNPFKYFEPVGFFCILIFGYGWGQPVPTSPLYYKDRRRGVLITYITPSVVNLLVGVIAAVLTNILSTALLPTLYNGQTASWLTELVVALLQGLYLFAQCNIKLALFNILPVYPLDGAKILQLFLKPDLAVRMTQYEKIFQIILVILLIFGLVGGVFDTLTNLVLRVAQF